MSGTPKTPAEERVAEPAEEQSLVARADSAEGAGAEALAGRLLKSARPARPPVVARQRVWARVSQFEPQTGLAWAWRPALITSTLLVAFVALASAMLGRDRIARVLGSSFDAAPAASPLPVPVSPPMPGSIPDTAPRQLPNPPASAGADSPVAAAIDTHESVEANGAAAIDVNDTVKAINKAPRVRITAPKIGVPEGMDEGTRLVAGALELLRKKDDPARALVLLEKYLADFHDGILVEEALALAIDAAARMDDPRSVTLSVVYLERFPTGRFVDLARTAQRRAPAR